MSLRGRWRSSAAPESWRPLEAVCPFLALATDARVALDTPDGEQRCHAVDPHPELSRREQTRLCLTGRHRSCPRYLTRVGHEQLSTSPGMAARHLTGAVALGLAPTRIVATPRPITITTRAAAVARPLALAGTAVASLVLVVSLGTAAANLLTADDGPREGGGRQLGRVFPDASRAPLATPPPAATPSPIPSAAPTVAPALPTSTATPIPFVPTPAPAPPEPEPVAYVVQKGDTLIGIAARFGTTAEAIMAYNGLESDVILIDQVLLIP